MEDETCRSINFEIEFFIQYIKREYNSDASPSGRPSVMKMFDKN